MIRYLYLCLPFCENGLLYGIVEAETVNLEGTRVALRRDGKIYPAGDTSPIRLPQ